MSKNVFVISCVGTSISVLTEKEFYHIKELTRINDYKNIHELFVCILNNVTLILRFVG